jgi:AcrR family transcriptional regulator
MGKKQQPVKRGRPPRLSREQILEAALKLLEKGAAEVTLNGVARALEVGPMSLYTHIENRDDLLLGVSELVLGKLQLELNADHWQDNVRLWVDQVQAHFQRYPQIVKLLGEGKRLSLEWMRLEAQLVTVLEQAGLPEEDLISTSNLLSQAIIFDCILGAAHARGRGELQLPELSALSDEDRHSAQLLYRHTPVEGHSLLDFVLEQLLQRARLILHSQTHVHQGAGG